MNTYLFCWNPKKWHWETLAADAQRSAAGEVKQDNWTCLNSHVQPGDRAFLMMLGRLDRGIIASGWTTSDVYPYRHWDTERARRGEKSPHVDCEWEKIIDPAIDSPLSVSTLQKELSSYRFDWTPQASGIRIPDEIAPALEGLWDKHVGGTALAQLVSDEDLRAMEGPGRIGLIRHRRREWKLRDAKIKGALHDGRLRCEVPDCGFDFHEVYGRVGLRYAQVHHLKPLSDRSAPTETKLSDLAVICANCHVMIHRGGKCRPLEGLIHHRPR